MKKALVRVLALALLAGCGVGKGRIAAPGTTAEEALLTSMERCGCEASVEFVRNDGMYALALIRYPVQATPRTCVDDAWLTCRKFATHIRDSTWGCRPAEGGLSCVQGVTVRPGFYGVSDREGDYLDELKRLVERALESP